MFGLMKPHHSCESGVERKQYRLFYCGVCKTMGQHYGHRMRVFLNHDIVFLAGLPAAKKRKRIRRSRLCSDFAIYLLHQRFRVIRIRGMVAWIHVAAILIIFVIKCVFVRKAMILKMRAAANGLANAAIAAIVIVLEESKK